MTANTYGRQVVLPLTNKSGGGVVAGDVVIVDTTNNDAFTTTTSAATTAIIGVAQETIASNAIGRVLLSGYAALVNVNASVTRGHYGATHTVAKQAADLGTSRGAGAFCQFLTAGTTPDAMVWATDLGAGTASGSITASGYTQTTARLLGRTTASTGAIEEITVGSGLSLSAGALTATGGGGAGALVLLATQTAANVATLDFTTRTASGQSGAIFQSDYDVYQIVGVNLICATNTQTFGFRAGTGGGPTYDSGANYYGNVSNGTAGYLIGTQSNAAGYGQGSFSVFLNDPQNAVQMKSVHGTAAWHDGTSSLGAAMYKLWAITTAMTAIQFLFTSGNITSGIVRIYGVAKT